MTPRSLVHVQKLRPCCSAGKAGGLPFVLCKPARCYSDCSGPAANNAKAGPVQRLPGLLQCRVRAEWCTPLLQLKTNLALYPCSSSH